MSKERLDVLLVQRGLVGTRSTAQALIMAGQVSADGKILDKPGIQVGAGIELHVKHQPQYASRAGDKLASVVEMLDLNFSGQLVLDVGSSTGGFTDYVLQHGARSVYCVDVGTAQLAQKLRLDDRVTVFEQTDIRDVRVLRQINTEPNARINIVLNNAGQAKRTKPLVYLPKIPDCAVIDVSFISLRLVLPAVAPLVAENGHIVAMMKPQFEVGKAIADQYRGVLPMGIERDQAIADFRAWVLNNGFSIANEADSAVPGSNGNVERFFVLRTNY